MERSGALAPALLGVALSALALATGGGGGGAYAGGAHAGGKHAPAYASLGTGLAAHPTPADAAFLAGVGDAFARTFPSRPTPRHDVRLDRVAAVLAELADEAPALVDRTAGRLSFELWKEGVVTPQVLPIAVRLSAGSGTPALLAPDAATLTSHLAAAPASAGSTHVGVALRKATDGGAIAVALLAREHVRLLGTFPATAAPGATVVLRARIGEGWANPRLLLGTPRGPVLSRALEAAALKGAREARVPFLFGAGEYRVEIVADGPRGPEVLALFPVWVGVPRPLVPTERLPLSAEASARAPAAPEALEAAALSMVNADRRAAGLMPLLPALALARAARAHSEEMRAAGTIGHVSSRTGDPADRVAALGLSFARVSENVGTGPTLKAAHEGFLDSPAHRANLLDAGVDAVGIGVATDAVGDGARVWVTYLFAAGLRPATGAAPTLERTVWEELGRARAAAGLPALREDEAATRAARDHALAMLAHGGAAHAVGGISIADLVRLHGAATPETSVAFRVTAADAPTLGAAWPAVGSASYVRAGVGVARSVAPGRSVFVAVALLGP